MLVSQFFFVIVDVIRLDFSIRLTNQDRIIQVY